MELVRNTAADREFEHFAAEASDPLLRTGYLMTGNDREPPRNWFRRRLYGSPGGGTGCG